MGEEMNACMLFDLKTNTPCEKETGEVGIAAGPPNIIRQAAGRHAVAAADRGRPGAVLSLVARAGQVRTALWLGKMNVPLTNTADPTKPMVDSIGSRKRRLHGLSIVLRNRNKMEATVCPDWKRGSPLSSLWGQLNRILGIPNNMGVQCGDVILPYCVVVRNEFKFKDIGNLPSRYDDEIRYFLCSVSHIPGWFDDNMDITQMCL